ncbi:hypothetical protein BH23CHL5_BH23CHL5_19820 [soil metagenome]
MIGGVTGFWLATLAIGKGDGIMAERFPDISEISAAVDTRAGDLVELTQQLVRIQSVTGEEGLAQEFVADTFEKLGLDVDMWEPDPGELAPYSEDVGEFESLRGRPNVVGTWHGSGREILDSQQPY